MLIALGACATDDSMPTAETTVVESQSKWDDALPALQSACGACHGNTANVSGLDWLAGTTAEEIRENLIASGVVDFENPYQSKILTKGIHAGPWFTSSQLDVIVAWIESEAH